MILKSDLFRSGSRLVGVLLCGGMLFTPAQGSHEAHSNSAGLEGTWFTQVTARDCQTKAVLRMFPAMNTFHSDETLTDTTTGIVPSQRSPGLGKWEQTGPQRFSAVSIAFLFTPAGVPMGTQKLIHLIEMHGSEISFTSSFTIFDTAGTAVSSGCATAVGRRI